MTLLDFARGPALEASLIIFVVGTLWRFLGTLLLPWRLIAAEPRAGAPSAFVAALRGIVVKLWPYEPFQKSGVVQFVNGYIFHLGLAVVVFLFVPHILFIRSLTGLSWPGLPNNLVMMVGVITAASLIVALVFRLTSPVLRLISRADDLRADPRGSRLELAQTPQDRPIEIPECHGLDPVSEHAHEQPSRKMGGSDPAQMVSPVEAKLIHVEAGKPRDRRVEHFAL